MQTLESLYKQLDFISLEKNKAIQFQQFEKAASLRDTEKKLMEEAEESERKHKLFLSKSKYVRGLNCSKSLWLYVHKYEEQTLSEAQESIFQNGTDAGIMARNLFPNGVLAVPEGSYPGFSSAAYTQSLIEKGTTTIYEATFVYENIIVAVDVLDFKNGIWNIFEVKSTTRVKDYHIQDAAIQYYVLSKFFKHPEIYIVHFNSGYVRKGDLNLEKLFTASKITTDVIALQKDISTHTRNLKLTIMNDEPEVEMGSHCTNPFTCSFYDYCERLHPEQADESTAIPSDMPLINQTAIQEFIADVTYQIGFLDFETIIPAVPMFDQSRPYQQLVFQFSLHKQSSVGSATEHVEILADTLSDPRTQIIPYLIEHTEDLQTVFVYNISFERSRIYEMARDFPQYATPLYLLASKLMDLMPVFRNWYRTESMGSRYSIKVVLPDLCPDLNYDHLEIADGLSASNAFLGLYSETDPEKALAIRAQLTTYCTQDTYALVRLWEILKGV